MFDSLSSLYNHVYTWVQMPSSQRGYDSLKRPLLILYFHLSSVCAALQTEAESWRNCTKIIFCVHFHLDRMLSNNGGTDNAWWGADRALAGNLFALFSWNCLPFSCRRHSAKRFFSLVAKLSTMTFTVLITLFHVTDLMKNFQRDLKWITDFVKLII